METVKQRLELEVHQCAHTALAATCPDFHMQSAHQRLYIASLANALLLPELSSRHRHSLTASLSSCAAMVKSSAILVVGFKLEALMNFHVRGFPAHVCRR